MRTDKMTVSVDGKENQPDAPATQTLAVEPNTEPIRWRDGEPIFVEKCSAATYNGQYDYKQRLHGKPHWIHENNFPSIWWNKADGTWNIGVYEMQSTTHLPPRSGYIDSELTVSSVDDGYSEETSTPVSKQNSTLCLLTPQPAAAHVESLYGPAQNDSVGDSQNQLVDTMMVAPDKLTDSDISALISMALQQKAPQLDKSRFQTGSNGAGSNVAKDKEQCSASNSEVSVSASEDQKENSVDDGFSCPNDSALCISLRECHC